MKGARFFLSAWLVREVLLLIFVIIIIELLNNKAMRTNYLAKASYHSLIKTKS